MKPPKENAYEITGQKFMAAAEVGFFLKKWRLTFSTWKSSGCDAGVVEEVKTLLGAGSASASQSQDPISNTLGHIAGQALGLHKEVRAPRYLPTSVFRKHRLLGFDSATWGHFHDVHGANGAEIVGMNSVSALHVH